MRTQRAAQRKINVLARPDIDTRKVDCPGEMRERVIFRFEGRQREWLIAEKKSPGFYDDCADPTMTKVGRDLDSSPIALVRRSKLDSLHSMPLHSVSSRNHKSYDESPVVREDSANNADR